MENTKVRVQKVLSECGFCSRRKAEELVAEGRVKINGRKAEIGIKINPKKDLVTVDGERVNIKPDKGNVYIMLHKPRGFVTTLKDEYDRRCVTDLLTDLNTRVYPVGRLDRNSEGLLIMTNDGEFANMLMHPKFHVPKTYRVTLHKELTEEQIISLSEGIEIDGRMTSPCDVTVLVKTPERVVIEIILYEGRNRQIRKMFEAVGIEVVRLKRTAIGNVKLGMLKPGAYRDLTDNEIASLVNKANTNRNTQGDF